MEYKTFIGNKLITKPGINVSTSTFVSSSGTEIDLIPLARADGDAVGSERIASKQASISGNIDDVSIEKLSKLNEEIERAFNQISGETRLIRYVHNYVDMWDDITNITGVSLGSANFRVYQEQSDVIISTPTMYGWDTDYDKTSGTSANALYTFTVKDITDIVPNSVITNGDFETFTGTADDGVTDTFTSWTNSLGGGTNTIEASTDKYYTAHAIKLTRGTGSTVSIYQDVTLEANTEYIFSYYAKNSTANVKVTMQTGESTIRYLQDDTTSWTATNNNINSLVNSGATYSKSSLTFKTPNYAGTYRITLANDLVGNSLIDGVILRKKVNASFNFSFYMEDVSDLESVYLRIGENNNNSPTYKHFETTLTTNYEGRNFENGENLVSVDLWNMTERGIIDGTNINRFYFQFYTSARFPTKYNIVIDNVHFANEDTVRNYPSRRNGEMRKDGNNYNITFRNFDQSFINVTGKAIATHAKTTFTTATVTTATSTQNIDIKGSTSTTPSISLGVTTATGISAFKLIDLSDNSELSLLPSTVVAGSTIDINGQTKTITKDGTPIDYDGELLEFKPGKNQLQLQVTSSSPTTITQASRTSETTQSIANDTAFYVTRVAQQFTATATGNVTGATMKVRLYDPSAGSDNRIYNWMIVADNAGNPTGSILGSGTFNININGALSTVTLSGLSASVTNGSLYWLVLTQGYRYDSLSLYERLYWDCSTANPYAGGIAKQTTNASANWSTADGTWSTIATTDMVFSVTISPVPAWNVTMSSNYKPLYLS